MRGSQVARRQGSGGAPRHEWGKIRTLTMEGWDGTFSAVPCRACGHFRLRRSRYLSIWEQLRCWWRNTAPFRCQSCNWRGELPDVWIAPVREAAAATGERLNLERLDPPDTALPLETPEELVSLWLDDQRPAPDGWVHVTNVQAAQRLLARGLVKEASLDHDLGWCSECRDQPEYRSQGVRDHCPHVPSGYDLCLWMAMTGYWPHVPPTVHSGNVEGAARMRGVILRHWRAPGSPPTGGVSADEAAQLTKQFDDLRLGVRSSKLSACPACGCAALERLHRRTGWQRLRSAIFTSFPVRCQRCTWEGWIKGPIMVRLEPAPQRQMAPLAEDLDHLDM